MENVVGRMLQRPFVVDPSLRDRTITLRTTSPIAQSAVLPLLDQALRLSGAALIERADRSVEVVPVEKVQGLQTTPVIAGSDGRVGAYVIVPLQYVSAKEMGKVLESVADRRSIIRVDEAREAIVLAGEPRVLDALVQTIALFDVDWLASASFDLVPVRHAPVETLASEVRRVMGGEGGVIGSQIELFPIARLRSIMVISKRPERLPQVRQWIARLDVPPPSDGRSVRFRGVRYLPANEIVEALSGLMGGVNARAPVATPSGGSTPAGPSTATPSAGPMMLDSGVRIQPAPRVNGLLIYSTAEEFARLDEAIAQIDAVPVQIMVEATIAEVTLNDQLRYGVQWFFDTRDGGTATFSSSNNGAVAAAFPGFSYSFQGLYVRAAINALSGVTNVQILSSPQLVSLSGQTARLQVGDQVPVITQQATGINEDARIINNVEYRDTGVVLSVTPRAGSDGLVLVDIMQEVSDVAGTTSSGIDSPTIQQRRFETKVAIKDGETIALGGLIRTTRSNGRTGVPLLSAIPGVRTLFSTQDNTERRTELIIFLTPRVMRSFDDIAETTQDMRGRLTRLKQTGFGE